MLPCGLGWNLARLEVTLVTLTYASSLGNPGTDSGVYPAQARPNSHCTAVEKLGQQFFSWVIEWTFHHCKRILCLNMEACDGFPAVPFLFLSLLKWISHSFKILGAAKVTLGPQSKKNKSSLGLVVLTPVSQWCLHRPVIPNVQNCLFFFSRQNLLHSLFNWNREVKGKITSCFLPWILLYQSMQLFEKEIHNSFLAWYYVKIGKKEGSGEAEPLFQPSWAVTDIESLTY